MENFFEKNLALLSNQYPPLAARLENPLSGNPNSEDLELRILPSASGLPTLTFGGISIHSPRDPLREARRLASLLEGGEGPVIILGFGLGYGAEAAAEAFPGRPLIIVEKRWEILRAALEARDLTRFFSSVPLVLAIGDHGGATGALELFKGKPVLLKNPALIRLDEAWYREAEEAIQAWRRREEVNAATKRKFGKRWVRNLGANMSAIRDIPGITALKDALLRSGIPVLLAAAGPSLGELSPWVREAAERCVVVAADTSLRFFLTRGVNPDFAVSVDPQFWNARHLDFSDPAQTCLIAESAAYPSVLRLSFRRIRLCASLFPLGRFIEDRLDPKGALGAGGSVATTAWDFARHLGAREIWTAGLDLSFPDLKTHFRGARFEEQVHSLANRLSPGETWSFKALEGGQPFNAPNASGGLVLTDRRLSLYSSWFENRFSAFPEIRNYSLSSQGLAINGLHPRSIEEFLALPSRREEIRIILEETFRHEEEAFFQREERTRREAGYQEALDVLLRGLGVLADLARKGAELAEVALQDKTQAGRIVSSLEEINSSIQGSDVKDVAGFLFPPFSDLEAELERRDPLERHIELSRALYRELGKTALYHMAVLG